MPVLERIKSSRMWGGGSDVPQGGMTRKRRAVNCRGSNSRFPEGRANSVKAILFDGDDTLWSTQPLYEKSKVEFGEVAAKEGIAKSRALRLLAKIDLRNVARYGFRRSRFPLSLVQTYEQLVSSAGRQPDPRIVAEVRRLGNAVFSETPPMKRGAIDLLRRLAGRVKRILVTAGDPKVQWSKIQRLGVAPYFDSIYVPKLKSTAELKRILRKEGIKPAEAILVGNSARSDVLPALEAGVPVVWLESRGWDYDTVPLKSGNVQKAGNLSEVAELIKRAVPAAG
jgi:putative hydrolase of the HAD superfamily